MHQMLGDSITSFQIWNRSSAGRDMKHVKVSAAGMADTVDGEAVMVCSVLVQLVFGDSGRRKPKETAPNELYMLQGAVFVTPRHRRLSAPTPSCLKGRA